MYIIYIFYYILYYSLNIVWAPCNKHIVGVRAGARTGYVIPGRDGIGGLDLARNSSAAAAAVAAAVRGEGEGGGGEGFEILVTLAPYWEPTGRDGTYRKRWNLQEEMEPTGRDGTYRKRWNLL